MRHLIHDHPITSRLFGIGLPGWIGFAAAGWPLAIIVALSAVIAIIAWKP